MIDLGLTQDRVTGAPLARSRDELNELYRRTKLAQAQAEEQGFAGTAAALADIADTLAWEAGVDPAAVWALAGCGPASPAGHTEAWAGRGWDGSRLTQH